MIVAGVWTGVGFSNLKNSRTRIQKFWNRSGIGVWKSDSDHLWLELLFFSTFCSLAPLLFGTSVIWHLCICYLAPLLFGGGDDEPVSHFQANFFSNMKALRQVRLAGTLLLSYTVVFRISVWGDWRFVGATKPNKATLWRWDWLRVWGWGI